MKDKYLILVLFMLFTVALFGSQVSENQVRRVAQNLSFEKSGQNTNIQSINYVNQDPKSYIYVVNVAPRGFVLIAADDASHPVLGFDFTNNWTGDNIPIQLQDYIASWINQMRHIKENHLSADTSIRTEWQKYDVEPIRFVPQRNERAVAPLISSTWGQGTYYNALCPSGTPVGCVATAMSQIMKYWSFPPVGLGSHSYTPSSHPSYGVQTANFGTTTYNWSGMPLSVNSSNTSVATLCYQAGVSVDMDYDPTGSGAYSSVVPSSLISYFRYKNTAQYKLRSSYTESAWNTLMVGELDNSRPVYYAGDGPSGGHAFILDGYSGTNYFHLNWGWDGWYNGYFYLSSLNPGGDTFNSNQDAVIGIQPSDVVTTLSEGFEGSTFPPTDWTVTTSTFARSATSYITGAYSARYSVTATGSNASGKQLRTPKLTVSSSSAPITFKAKRGTNARGEEVKVGYSTSATGPYTYFTTNAALTATAQTFTYAVTGLTAGSYYFVFETYSATTTSNAKLWIIDDVTGPAKWVDPNPIAAINITSWAAGSTAPGTASQSGMTFQLSNIGQGALTITSVTNLSSTEYRSTLNPSVSLVSGQIHEFGFVYEPINYSTDNLTYQIVTNGGTINISLTGTGEYAESFENYPDFSLSCSPWTQYDGDGGTHGGINNVTYANSNYVGSFMVFNPSATSPAVTDAGAHTGSKYAACFYSSVIPNNDWLISPEMTLSTSGTLSFWAKEYSATYSEAFRVLYSTTTNAIASFTNYLAGSASTSITPTTTWTQYTYTLPQTAKYFAIQCVSRDAFFLMIDDISSPNSPTPPLEFGNISGYVYRSGTTTPVVNALITAGTKTAYSDATGFYRINNLTVGTYPVTCDATGQFLFKASQSIAVTNGNTTTQNFSLTWAEMSVNQSTLSASVYSSETNDQTLAISNPAGTANLQYAMWFSTASRNNHNQKQLGKCPTELQTPGINKIIPPISINNDRATGWMGYTDWDAADTYLTGATTNREKSTKFTISDFAMWSNGVTISKLRALFYNSTDDPWGTATNFYFKIYGASGTGTALYTSPTYTATSLTTMEDVLATPLVVTTDFWVSVYCVTSGGKPSLVGSSDSYGNSYYGTSSAAWTAASFDWCLDAYVTGSEWVTATPTSGTVAPTITQNVIIHFDSNLLSAGTKTAYLNIANNANYSSPSARGDIMVIPVSFTVTVPSVPFLTLNTNSWTTNTVLGTPTSTGNVYTISNVGTGTITITSIHGLNDTPFSTNFNTATTLTHGQTYSFGFTYTPTTTGIHNATFTITTNGGTKTITISAYTLGVDYQSENFAGANFPPAGWQTVDNDGDGYNWYAFRLSGAAHSDTTAAGSASYINAARNESSRNGSRPALTPDNWLITPRLAINEHGLFTYWVAAQDPDWPAEHYSVYVSTTNNQIASFSTELFNETLVDGDWHQRVIDLSAYNHENVYLAFRHHGCTDQFVMKIDDVQMPPLAAPLTYGNITGTVTRMLTSQPVVGATVSIGGNTGITNSSGVYTITGIVTETYQLSCTMDGFQTKTISVSIPANSTLTQDIMLDWGDVVPSQSSFIESQEINTTHSYPFSINNPGNYAVNWEVMNGGWSGDTVLGPWSEDFETFEYTSWSGSIGQATDVYAGYGYEGGTTSHTFVFESLHSNDYQWLITPKLHVTSGDHFNFWYKQLNASSETFDLLISTTTTDTTAFTTTLSNIGPLSDTNWVNYNGDLSTWSGSDIYIAFKYTKKLTQYAYVFIDNITGPSAYVSPEHWLTCSDATGETLAGETTDLSLNIDTNGLGTGNYSARTWIFTDGVTSPVSLDVDLTVTQVLDATTPQGVVITRPSTENMDVQISWDASEHADHYDIYAYSQPLPFDQYVHLRQTNELNTVISDADLTAIGVTGNHVFFKVTADNGARVNYRVASIRKNNRINHSGLLMPKHKKPYLLEKM